MKTTPRATPAQTAADQTAAGSATAGSATAGSATPGQAAATAGLTIEQQASLVVLEGFLAGTSHDIAALTQVQEALLVHSKQTNGRVDF
jgi:hypothetical protein